MHCFYGSFHAARHAPIKAIDPDGSAFRYHTTGKHGSFVTINPGTGALSFVSFDQDDVDQLQSGLAFIEVIARELSDPFLESHVTLVLVFDISNLPVVRWSIHRNPSPILQLLNAGNPC